MKARGINTIEIYWAMPGESVEVPVPQVWPWGSLGLGPRTEEFDRRPPLNVLKGQGVHHTVKPWDGKRWWSSYHGYAKQEWTKWNCGTLLKVSDASSEFIRNKVVIGWSSESSRLHCVHEIAALATPSPVSHDIMFWSWGKICPKPIQVAKNLPHAARLLDSPRATCYLQPHSNWMNCWVATYLILLASSMRPRQHFGFYWNCFLSCPSEKMEKLDRNWGKFLFIQYSILKILINHGITSYWNHDTRLM
jgi:hypothetical protein